MTSARDTFWTVMIRDPLSIGKQQSSVNECEHSSASLRQQTLHKTTTTTRKAAETQKTRSALRNNSFLTKMLLLRLLLLLSATSLHVSHAWVGSNHATTATGRTRLTPLSVLTEPPPEISPDYYLQTEDYSASHAPRAEDYFDHRNQLQKQDNEEDESYLNGHDLHHTNGYLSERWDMPATLHLEQPASNYRIVEQAQEETEGEELDSSNIHLPPRFVPRSAWKNHHQATVNWVHGMRRNKPRESGKIHLTIDEEEALRGIRRVAKPLVPAKSNDQKVEEPAEESKNEGEPAVVRTNQISNFFQNLMNRPKLVSECSQWRRLAKHAEYIQTQHLRDFLQDEARCEGMYATHDGVYLDYSRNQVTLETMKFLYELAEKQDLKGKIDAMVKGEKINFTEDRAVLHTALRAERELEGTVMVDGMDVIKEVHEVLDQIKEFTEGVRSGKLRGYTGKRLRNIVSVGIGGSYLGPEFLHECLKTEPEGINAALGYSLRFLSNVDPVDVERTCADLDPEETLVVVVSKTFTTAETMLNAKTMRQWLWDFMGNDKEVVRKHMVACASLSSLDKVEDFGIDTDKRFFRFWDFVGGRYSVCSAAGAVPISLLYGFDLFEKFLKGANSIDKHFVSAPFDRNIPVLMGLLGVWNMSFLKYQSRTTLPYAEALLKLPAHIQQLDMESNGKSMTKQGLEVDYPVGEIDFGEAGTNGQHSFYQLLHMGQVVPCDFIGFVQSQHDFCVEGESLSSHDELMANFFAQPDALANGKTADEVRAEGVPEELVGHKVFKGNRPSLSLLLPKLTAYACGQLLAIYEHRTAVQGFLWDINSFDQWGVELGKKLANDIKDRMIEGRTSTDDAGVDAGSPATSRLLNYYLANSCSACQPAGQGECDSDPGNGQTKVTRKTHREHNAPPPLQHDLGGHHGKLS
eukprot:scaffold2702_cov168-Amphora_coffeaeformis.AAC.2